ncbi:MAG: EAL domain-containing protein [Acidobacteriota bacterium]|nr:EAL domain-containing protein [Acidobacteriota bacterium]
MTALAFPLLLTAGAAVGVALYAWRHRDAPGGRYFAPLQLTGVIWLVAAAMEAISVTYVAKSAWSLGTFVGSLPLPVFWLLFTLDFTGATRVIRRQMVVLISIVPAISAVLVVTSSYHDLIWLDSKLTGGNLEIVHGLWFKSALAPYGWFLIVVGMAALIRHYFRTEALYRGQCAILIVSATVPLTANILYVTGHSPIPEIDPTPLGFCIATLLIGWSLFFYRFLDMAPVAFEAVFKSMSDGVVVLDPESRITKINPVGLERLGLTAEEVLGKPVMEVHSHWPDTIKNLGLDTEGRTEFKSEHDGRPRNLELRVFPLTDWRGEHAGRVVISQDVTERNAYQRRIEEMAYRDFLTGLPNRRALHDAADKSLALARRRQWGVAVIFLDLDRFKPVNDALGHPAGDLLLQLVASRLESQVRTEDTLARLGGDEFALLMQDCSAESARHAADRMLQGLRERPFDVKDTVLQMDASVGIALYPQAGSSVDDLLAQADVAMYQAKQGPNRISFYDASQDNYTQEQLQLEAEFRNALDAGELLFKYQPFLDLDTRKVTAVEALLRWEHPSRGLTHPSVFLPMVEERGMARQLDHHVLEHALKEGAKLGIDLSINLSTKSLLDPSLPNYIKHALSLSGLPAKMLILEITERALAVPERVRPVLVTLRHMGIRIAADDFGTGYSALAYLRQFPLNILKLDRYLISGIGSRVEDEAIIRAVIMIAESMGLDVVAEGVENRSQLEWLKEQGCHLAQGFHIAKPLRSAELLKSGLLPQPEVVAVGARQSHEPAEVRFT